MKTTSERLRSLVEGLYLATMDGRVKWQLSKSADDVYVTNFPNGAIDISSESTGIESEDIRLNVYNLSGDTVDSFTDRFFSNMQPQEIPKLSYFGIMEQILEAARRSATGADKIVDGILKTIGAPTVVEGPKVFPSSDLDDAVPF